MEHFSKLIGVTFVASAVALSLLIQSSHCDDFPAYDSAQLQLQPQPPPPPVAPQLISHLAEELTPAECYDMINYLISQSGDPTPEDTRQKVRAVAGSDPSTFDCRRGLDFWDGDGQAHLANLSEEEKAATGEGLLMLALKFVQRKDLDEWIKQERSERLQAQVRLLKKEMARHREEGLAQEMGKPPAGASEGTNAEQAELLVAEADAAADAEEVKRKEELTMKVYIVTGVAAIIVCLALVFVAVAKQCMDGRRKTYVRLVNDGGGREAQNLYESGDESEWSL